MEFKPTRKLSVIGSGKSYYITLPKEMIKELRWKKGERKIVELRNGEIVISDWKK